MAHGWDSYFHSLPSLSSDPSTLRSPSESEGGLSQRIENFIGHDDFPDAVASDDVATTNTNYYSNPSMENPSSDCLFQRYCNETPWQGDGEQMEKDYMPKCENSGISDFATDGLSTSESFPSSFATDLQELKQDCGILATSFIEDYSDVSSCSDAGVGETRPSCQFMTSSSVPKPKTFVTTNPSSSEWLFTDTGTMMVSTESGDPNVLETNAILPGTSNAMAGENIVECAQDKMERPEKNVNTGQSSSTCNMATTAGSETVEDGNDCGASTDGKKRNMQENECDKIEVLKREKETFDEVSTNPKSADSEDENMETKSQEQEIQSYTSQPHNLPDINVSDCKEATDELGSIAQSPAVMSGGHFSSTNGKIEQRVASHSEPCPSTDASLHLERERTSQAEKKNTMSSPDPHCNSPGVTSDTPSVGTSDENEQVALTHVKSCLWTNSSCTDINPCLGKECTSLTEKESTTSSAGPDWGDPVVSGDDKEICVSNCVESHSQSSNSSMDLNHLEKELKNLAENANPTNFPGQEQSLYQSPEATEDLNGDVAKMDTSAEEPSMLGMVYGEPLSREDSSCDSDETKLDTDHNEDTSVGGPYSNSMDCTERQTPQLKSSLQMRKRLQPIVMLKTSESVNGKSNSYHCAGCQHTTHNVDLLIEHHHCCHSVHKFQFCKTCNMFLMSNEQAETHVCLETKNSPHLPLDSSLPKKGKRRGSRRCFRCGLIFSRLIQYIAHMRSHTGKTPYQCNGCGLYFSQSSSLRRHKKIPGRCKNTQLSVTETDVVSKESEITTETESPTQTPLTTETESAPQSPGALIKEAKEPSQKDLGQNKPYEKLPECYVKLVNISKTHICNLCDKSFLTASRAKKHFYNIHKKGKRLLVSLKVHQCTTNHSGEKKVVRQANETIANYKCPLCPRLFKYSYNRARHLRDCVKNSVYGGKDKISGKYRCPLCHVTFTLPGNRYRHIKTFCLRECVNRLAREGANSKEHVKQSKTKETEQTTQPKLNEQRKQPEEVEQKKNTPLALTCPKPVPRFKCSICPAVFFHASGRSRHVRKHELSKLTGKKIRYRNSVLSTMSKPDNSSSTKTEDSKDKPKSAEANESLALSCNFCGRCFETPQSLKKHVRNHRGEKPYSCLDCGKRFKKRAHLIAHKSIHQRRIQCTVCRKILPTIRELIQHRSSHLKRGMLRCPDCPQQFQYPAHLLRHLPTHKTKENKTKSQDTSQCEVTSLSPQQSMESVEEQGGPNQLQCSLCKEVFDDAQVLRKHCLTHISGSSSHQCPFCKQYFSNRRYLLRHMVIHTGNKPLSCTNCGRQFYREVYLKLHRKKCLPVQSSPLVTVEPDIKVKRPHQCSYCPRTFGKKMRLMNHHHAHKANTLLLCSRCGQYFGSTKLNQHQKNCTGTSELNTVIPSPDGTSQAQPESQNVSTVSQKSNATKLLHFKCPHCTKRFRFRSLLLRHLVSHTGVQPYACTHCGRSFRSRTMCLQHEDLCNGVSQEGQSEVKEVATETQLSKKPSLRVAAQTSQAEGEAEFKCKFCTKTFIKSQSLRRHILTHNEVKPYRCKACESCFSRYDHLKVHQARCKGKKTQLQVCIPKISLDYVGTGWQNKIGTAPAEKQETFKCEICSTSFSSQSQLSRHVTMFHVTKTFKCTRCESSFADERSLKKHRKRTKCRKLPTAPNAFSPPENKPPTENVTNSLKGVRSTILQRVHPYLNKNYKHTCIYCPRVFQNSWQLAVHIRLHTGERPYVCNDCGQRFIRKDYLQRHYTKCTKRRCNSTASLSRSTVCRSQQSPPKSPPKGFSCAYCTSRFLLFSQLQEHFLNAHKLETKVPPMSTAPLQHHLSNIPNVKEEPLDEFCDKPLSKTGDNLICKLDADFESEVPNSLSCPECNMSFTNKAGLSSHLRVHSSEHPYHCKICKKGFWNKNVLRNHNRKCRFGCVSVKKTTQPNQEVPLKAEIDLVLNDPVLVFKEASKSSGTGVLQTNFSCKDALTGESPENSKGNQVQSSTVKAKKAVQYQCSECEMSFTDGLMLISHLEDHGRQEQAKKNNTCVECGQTFASQGNLARHLKIHGPEKKYPCPDCPKILDTPSDLEIHRTCHDPNRPFMCKLCNHRFWTRPSLCNHYREEHPDDAFTCRFCNKAYSVKKSLARHYRRWHQKEQRDLATNVQEKNSTEQSSGQVSTPGESDEDENTGSEDSDSDSAPYFPCHVCGKTFPTSESLEDHQRCHLGEKPHECAECGRCFFQASQLQQHQRMHKSEFQCQACGRGFVSLFALRKHKHSHGKSRPYRCSKCDFSFTGPLQLAEHMSTHREENFPCDICNLVFGSKISRAEHRKCHSKSGPHPPPSLSKKEHEKSASISENSSVSEVVLKYRCGVCGERFRDPEELSEHGCMAAKERPYSCSDCDKHFLHASHLKMHRATHQLSWSVNEYHCNQCNNSYSTSQGFLSHLINHDGTAAEIQPNAEGTGGGLSHNFTCPVCQQCFASATELIRHFPIHPGGTFECKMCKMTFPSRSKLEEHEHLHMTSATEFECTECGQSFLGRDAFCQHRCTLQQHTTRKAENPNPSAKNSPPTYYQAAGEDEEIDVTGEDMYNCPVCSMQFSSKSVLLEHQNKQHHGEKPFKCDLCEKTFARRRYLREHERRHRQKIMAQQKLRCTQCRAEFSTSHDLTLHMRLHAEIEVGEFRCDMCYKSFSQWSHLKQHQESHVGQVVYECTECDKAFAFPHLLEEHQQTHAGSSQ